MDQNTENRRNKPIEIFWVFVCFTMVSLTIFWVIYTVNHEKLADEYIISGNVKKLEKFMKHHGSHHVENIVHYDLIKLDSDISKFLVEKKILKPIIAFKTAVNENRQDIIDFLLEEKDFDFSEASFYLAKEGDLELLKIVKDKGSIDMHMAFKGAAEGGQIDIIKEILDYKN